MMLIERILEKEHYGRYYRIDWILRNNGRCFFHRSVVVFDGKAYIYHERYRRNKAIHVVDYFLLMKYLRRFKMVSP